MTASRSTSSGTNYSWDTNYDLPQLAMEGSLSYIYGEGPLGFVSSSGSYTYHTDALGSIIELSESNGDSVESYRYSPYGEADTEGGSSQADSSLGNSLRYAGQYLDSETDLYDMRAREYDPEVGRFLEIDPVEAAVGDPSIGVYVYVDDRPTVMVDPSGESVSGSGAKYVKSKCSWDKKWGIPYRYVCRVHVKPKGMRAIARGGSDASYVAGLVAFGLARLCPHPTCQLASKVTAGVGLFLQTMARTCQAMVNRGKCLDLNHQVFPPLPPMPGFLPTPPFPPGTYITWRQC